MFPTAAISGEPSDNSYCQTLTSGNFLVILSLQGAIPEGEMELGRNILAKIEEQTTQNPDIVPFEIVKMLQEQFPTEVELGLLVTKFEGQKLFLAGLGEMGAKLLRNDKVISLLHQAPDQKTEIKTISGPLLHDDLLILGTSFSFAPEILPDFLMFQNLSLEEIKDQLIPTVESSNDKGKICVVFVRVDLKNQIEKKSNEETLLPRTIGQTVPGITATSQNNPFFQSIFKNGRQWLPKRESFENPSSKRTLYLVLIIFVIIVSVIAFQLRSRNLETSTKNLGIIEASANEGINSASKLFGLNDQIARDSLVQTRKDVETQIENVYGVEWEKKSLPDKDRLNKILAKVDDAIGKVSHVYMTSKLDIFYDFSLMKSKPQIVSSNLHGGEIVSLDRANGAIYSLMTKNKAAALIVGNSSLKKANHLDFTPDTLFVWSTDGISQVKIDGSDSFKQIIKPSDKWGEIKGITAFGGNLYLLDSRNNQIWKYQGTDLGFVDLVNYIKTGLPVDISSGQKIQVDGFIYVLTQSGKIARFSGGDVSDFSFSGLPDPLSKVTAFFTSDDTENVYLWDNENKMIVVVDKKGAYQAEYKLSGVDHLPPITNILADESVKKIFLLSDSMVFSIDIK